jgi:hypothetical protein
MSGEQNKKVTGNSRRQGDLFCLRGVIPLLAACAKPLVALEF